MRLRRGRGWWIVGLRLCRVIIVGVVNICMMRRIGRGGYELSNLFLFGVGLGLLCFGLGLVRFVRDNSKKDETTMDDEI